jgi:hypothetical protein
VSLQNLPWPVLQGHGGHWVHPIARFGTTA